MEKEVKLSLRSEVASSLTSHPLLMGSNAIQRTIEQMYLDTPNHLLQREQVVVFKQWQEVVRRRLSLRRSDIVLQGRGEHYQWQTASTDGEPELDFSAVDDEALRQWLESLRGTLRPAFIARFIRRAWVVRPRNGVRIGVTLDRGWIEARGSRQPICELDVELLAGHSTDLYSTVRQLQSDIALHPETRSKAQQGYRVLEDSEALLVVKAQPLQTNAGMTTAEAFRMIALACVRHLQGNEEGLLTRDDPEFVHQARVAIRRLRSALRVWRPLLSETFVNTFDPAWQSLARELGAARNWDVFQTETLPRLLAEFPDQREMQVLADHTRKQCESHRATIRHALRSAEYSRLLVNFQAEVVALRRLDSRRLGAFAPRCLEKRASHVGILAGAASTGDATIRHRLRVACKRLRYALEFFAPLFAGQQAFAQYHAAVSRLQEALGFLNDLAVADDLVSEALPDQEGEAQRHWMVRQSEALLPDLEQNLREFHRLVPPWRESGCHGLPPDGMANA